MKNYRLKKINFIEKVRKYLKLDIFLPPILYTIKKYIYTGLLVDGVFTYKHPILKTFSWAYEDLILDDIFEGQKEGKYLDIGANDPILGNNTYRFYLRGWTGINIDGDPSNVKKLNNLRTNDLNLHLVMHGSGRPIEYAFPENDSSISFVVTEKTKMRKYSKLKKIKTIATTLPEVYQKYSNQLGDIDILSIDTEGNELQILSDNNWSKFRPTTVLMEINSDINIIQDFFSDIYYMPIFINQHNAIFLNELTQNPIVRAKFDTQIGNNLR